MGLRGPQPCPPRLEPFPKVSPSSAAEAILDGLEQGLEEIYHDPFAVELGSTYATNPKALEAQVAA